MKRVHAYRRLPTQVCLTAIGMALIASGCGAKTGSPKTEQAEVQAAPDPVTVKFFPTLPFSDEDFDKIVVQPVKKLYPHITIERHRTSLDNILTTGDIPDIIQTHNGELQRYMDLGILSPIDDLVKKHDVDLNRFDPVVIDSLRTDDGKLLGLPYAINFTALYYNKDLFDKFGVPYPKDGMTWPDAIEVGKMMSRQDGGVTYRGLDPENIGRIVRQMGMDYSDSKTMKSTMMNPNWKTMFEIGKAIYTIPGNEVSDVNGDYLKSFFSGTIAMTARVNVLDQLEAPTKEGLNWDLAQYPSIPGIPNVGGDVDPHMLVIPPTAKHRDAAILVAKAMTHDETQLLMVKTTARLSPLKSAANKEAFASEKPYLQGKRLDSIFKNHPIRSPMRTKYFGQTGPIAKEAFKAYVAGTVDLNTALRQADEKINAYLAGQAGK